MKAPRIPEKVIQRQIVHLLRSLGGLVWVLGTVRPAGDYPGTRQTEGLPDIIAAIRGHMLMIEVKAKGGRLRPEQEVFRQACRDCGVAHVVGGVDEVLAWLQQQGIVKPDAVPWYRQEGSSAKSPILAAPRRRRDAQSSRVGQDMGGAAEAPRTHLRTVQQEVG